MEHEWNDMTMHGVGISYTPDAGYFLGVLVFCVKSLEFLVNLFGVKSLGIFVDSVLSCESALRFCFQDSLQQTR